MFDFTWTFSGCSDSSWSRAKLNGQEVYIGSMSSFLDSIAHVSHAHKTRATNIPPSNAPLPALLFCVAYFRQPLNGFLTHHSQAHSAYYGLQFDSLDAYYHVPLPSSSRKHRQAASAGVSASDAKLEQRLNKKQEQGRDEGKRYRTTLELEVLRFCVCLACWGLC